MELRRLVITGTSGFLGRHLLDAIKDRFEIFCIARRSQRESGAPVHPNIHWFQVDIGDREALDAIFQEIADTGGAELVLHLAAHYDFTGEDHPEYWRTNVNGLRNVLECSAGLRIRGFFFASSLAACNFPPPGGALTEDSPPDGDHIYAKTKRIGEEMLWEYINAVPSVIIRFGAMFSDWCEYAPQFVFMNTWLTRVWNARILGGKGQSAIPYLHVRDAVAFIIRLLDRYPIMKPCEVLLASNSGSVTHAQLFEAATSTFFGREVRPVFMPKLLSRIGLYGMDWLGRALGQRPFERPWMGKYIDLKLTADCSHTYERLGWTPNPRLDILRRMPFLIEHLKTDPLEWNRRNRAAMKEPHLRPNLRVHRLLERHEQEILETLLANLRGQDAPRWFVGHRRFSPEDIDWFLRQVLRHLIGAVRVRDKTLFMAHCRDLAERRFKQGFTAQEVCDALATIDQTCVQILGRDPEAKDLDQALRDCITMTVNLGIDEVQDVYEVLGGRGY